MKKCIVNLAIAGIFSGLFISCSDDHLDTEGIDDTPTPIEADAFFEEHGQSLQAFTGDASSGFTVTGAGGTEISFPADAFVDEDGNIISGAVEIGIIEILTKKDLLLSGVATESNGQLLESGGELYIEALQNGETLYLNPANHHFGSNPVTVKLPRDTDIDPTDMILFNQGARWDDGLEDDSFTWLVFNESPDAMVQPYSYDFTIPNFGWINVDKFLNFPQDELTFVHVNLTAGSAGGLQDVAVLMVFENLNAVIGLNYDPVQEWFGTENFSVNPNLPIGEQIAVVIIAKNAQGDLYFDKQENLTITANALYTLTPQQATPQDIDWINNL